MKRNYGIPCPTCGFTTATSLFVTGGIIKAFWIQPAAAAMCVVLLFVAFFSLLSALIGINFSFLPPIRIWRIEYILMAGAIILAAGWAVTIARVLAELP
jgi:Na+/citrate or Na+/malate symporter